MDNRDRLALYPYIVVRMGCRLCSRRGAYRLARLAAKYGPEIGLRTSRCARRNTPAPYAKLSNALSLLTSKFVSGSNLAFVPATSETGRRARISSRNSGGNFMGIQIGLGTGFGKQGAALSPDFAGRADGRPGHAAHLVHVIARAAATKQPRVQRQWRQGASACGFHPFKYFVASRLATPVSFRPYSSRNRRTRLGSRFESSRSHQPTAF
jgi:hypothetical protein